MVGGSSIVAVLNLMVKFYNRCEKSSETYDSLREDIRVFSKALEDARPALLEYGKIDTYNECMKMIIDIQELLAKQSKLGTPRRNIRDIINWQFANARLPNLTMRLYGYMILLNLAVNSSRRGTLYEMNGAFSGILGGTHSQQTQNELDSNAIYEVDAMIAHELEAYATYELSGSIPSVEALRPEASPRPVDGTITPSQISVSSLSTVDTDYNLDLLPAVQLKRFSFSSQKTSLSATSSLSSIGRTKSQGEYPYNGIVNAAKKGGISLAWLLLQMKDKGWMSKLDQESIDMALFAVAKHEKYENGQVNAIHSLLNHYGADIEYRDKEFSRTPLIWAVSVGRADIVHALLDHQAPIDTKDMIETCTPIMWAVCLGRTEMVELLLSRGASLSAVDTFWKRTPLLWAAKKGAFGISELLLKSINDPQLIDAKDKDGKTALALAYTENHPRTARVILEHGADPNFRFKSGRPLLVSAVMSKQEGFVRLLVAKGANVRSFDVNGASVLSIASRDKSSTIAAFLASNLADLQAGAS